MAYLTVATMAENRALRSRVAACAAQEQSLGAPVDGDPTDWAYRERLTWAAAPGWSDAWESAEAGGVEDPGRDPGVITDAMILSRVQEIAPR